MKRRLKEWRHFEFGTSLWFEDIVGHRAIAEQTIIE